ncbi:hypothetical protein IQ260_21415 [Leptolyngbya cf. ectocarpi LEGE 11479]|uniref:Uncharacterized protein n=1 Tax=Leptolyngbya cf. ectocarpi LEGE 11479 TaxID=1828722 RepID=A0A928ZXF3_LEPEC|nr:hypothetical protein [Leptolyngbya ectocarpi]MBE9069208.1 hypothetical protein [Leptolyngbya cf. ectocarpi LEGE 11479]
MRSCLASDWGLAAAETQSLLLAAGVSIDSWDLQNLSIHIHKVFETLIDGYEYSFIFSPVIEHLHDIESEKGRLEAAALVIPKFEPLMFTLGPMLHELKALYFSSINRHLVGFMTTHMHFTQRLILSHLSIDERLWLAPYLQLLDELTCMPWQRICSMASAVTYHPDVVALVKRMLPKIGSISLLTYQKALQTYPHHISYQGRLHSEAVQRSSMRDLNMFQTYIWLCFLEGNMSAIEKKLLPICVQSFSLTNVKWELVNFAIKTLIESIHEQLTPAESALFTANSEAIQALFINAAPATNQGYLVKQQLQGAKRLTNVSYTWRP